MDAIFTNNDIILRDPKDFDLTHIFDCGQCFRFNAREDGSYIGTAYGKTIMLSKSGNDIILHNTTEADYNSVWRSFFDLDCDYEKIKARLVSDNDSVMLKATEFGNGIRILKQELWETLISFIISASNNIPRIKKIIESLCENFGTAHEYMGQIHYSFPSPEKLASLSEEDLSVIRAGFRTKYILACANDVVSGKLDLDNLSKLSTPDAKKTLMSIYGVGNKVSDCILLFGLGRSDAFPVDVWIKRIMEYCYFDGKEQSIKTISELAEKKFGELGGMAQQYLFFYARELKIGTAKNK